MLRLAIACLVIAVIAAALGFGNLAGDLVWLAKIFFYVFIVLTIAAFAAIALKRGK